MSKHTPLGAVREAALTTAGVTLLAVPLLHPTTAAADAVKTRAELILTDAAKLENHLFDLGQNRGKVIVINGCAYRVNTRIKLSDERKKKMMQIVPGSLAKYEEKDGKQVCSPELAEQNAPVEKVGVNLYHIQGHPVVIVQEADGGATLFPGLYDPHEKQWKVKDFTLGFTLTTLPSEMHLGQ